MSDGLKKILQEAKAAGASVEQLLRITETYKKKDSTELDSSGVQEATQSASSDEPTVETSEQIPPQIPNWMRNLKDGAPRREYEVKRTKPTTEQKLEEAEMFTASTEKEVRDEEGKLLYTEVSVDPKEVAKTYREQEQLRNKLDAQGYSKILYDYDLEANARAEEAIRAGQEYQGVVESQDASFDARQPIGKFGIPSAPSTKSESEMLDMERQAKIKMGNAFGWDSEVSLSYPIEELMDYAKFRKQESEGNLFEATLEMAKEEELKDPTRMGLTRTAFWDGFLKTPAANIAISLADASGNYKLAEKLQQDVSLRAQRTQLSRGIDPLDTKGIFEELQEGNLQMAWKKALGGVAESTGGLLLTIAAPNAGISYFGGTSYAATYSQFRDRADLNTSEKQSLALVAGAAEVAVAKVLGGVNNIRRFRAALGISDDIGKASLSARKKAFDDIMSKISPISEDVVKALKSPAVKGVGTTAIETGLEAVEEGIVSLVNQTAAAVIANDSFDPYEIYDSMILGGMMGAPLGAVVGRATTANERLKNSVYKRPLHEDISKFEELQQDYSAIKKDARKETDEERKSVLFNTAKEIRDEIDGLMAKAAEKYDSLSIEQQEELSDIHKEIHKLSRKIKKEESEPIKKRLKNLLKQELKKKAAIEGSVVADEVTAPPTTEAVTEEARETPQPEGVPFAEAQETAARTVSEAEKRVSKATPKTMENQRIRYFDPVRGELIEGTLAKEGQSLSIETEDNRIIEIGNFEELSDTPLQELGMSDAKEVIQINPSGSFTYNSVAGAAPQGTEMIPSVEGLKSIKRGRDGSIKRVVMKSVDGSETYNLTGQDAIDVAYQLHLQQLQTPESIAKVESELEKDEEARKILEAAEKRQQDEVVPEVDEVAQERPSDDTQPAAEEPARPRIEGVGLNIKEETSNTISRLQGVMRRIVPDLRVVLHASRDSYNQTYDNASKSNGHYNPDTKTAHILVDADTQLDNLTTLELLKHEIIHPLLDVFLQNSAAETSIAAEAVRGILNRLEGNRDAKKVLDHADKYKKDGRSQDVIDLELVTEFFAVFSNPASLVAAREASPTFIERVKSLLNRLLRAMHITDGKTQLENEGDVRELLEKLTFAFSTGAEIRASRQENVENSKEKQVKESLDNLGSPKNPYENAVTPKRGLEPIEIYREWVNSKSNFIIAENFEHSLEIRRAGFIESHQRKDGSIVLVEPSAYEKTNIDGVIQISSKSFMSDKDITDKRQKKISKTLSSFAEAVELPIAFVERPDLKFTSAIVYPDKVNGIKKPTMVVNLSFANARTGASAFSFAIVETLRKGVTTTEKNNRGESIEFTAANFNEMIRAFEGEQVGKIQISDKLRSIYSSYKDAFIDTNIGSVDKEKLEGQAQFHAVSMTIQESIDKMITDVVTPSANMDFFEFLSGIQEQLTAFLNSKLGDDNRKIFKVPLGEDFMELVGNVFVDKKIPINLELTAEQKKIESNLLERIEKTLTDADRLEKIQRTFEDLSDLHKSVGDVFQPLSVLEKAVELHQQGKISDFALENITEDAFMERGVYQRMNFNLDEADAYINEMSEIIESVGSLFLKGGVDFKRIYSDFSKWRATGFADRNVTPEMALYKRYYDTYPKSQQDWKFNKGAVNYSDVTEEQAREIEFEDFLDLIVIAEIAGMPYSLTKSSIEQIRVPDLENAFFEFQKSMSVKVISKVSDAKDYFESMAKESFEKLESAKDIDLDARSLSQSLKSFRDEFDYEILQNIARESSILDKSYSFEYIDENGKSKKGEILVELGITHNGERQRFIDVAYENNINESAYSDNKKNLINVMKTMSKVFEFTQAVAQIFGADGITYSAVQIGKGRVNEDTHAKNLVDKSKGFNTSWFRRGINSNMAIAKGGLNARGKRRVAFYDASFNPDYIYITESPDILGLASATSQNRFENENLSNQTDKIDSKEDPSFIIENALFPVDEKAFKVAKTETIPTEGLTSDEILEKVQEINNDSYVFIDSEVVLNINMQAQPFATRSSVISLSGIRESLADIDVEDRGREGAESLDAIQENAAKAILGQSESNFWKRITSRKTWVDRDTKLKKAMSRGFSRYVQALVVDRLGAGAYADRIYTRMRKEIYGKLDNTQLQILDNIIIARRIIDIDRTWDERLSQNQSKLNNELRQLKYYEEELKQAKIVKDAKLVAEIKQDIKNSKKIIADTESKIEKYSTRPLHPAPEGKKMNLEIAEATLKHYERTLDKDLYNKLTDRADKYFDAYRQILQMQFEAGLIDAETRDRFINNDYSPRRFLSKMFGGVDDITFQQMGLAKDQIQAIKGGSDTDMFTDTEFLLSLSLRAVQNKKAKNLLFNEMYKEAKKQGFENISDGEFIKDGNYKKKANGEPKEDAFGNYVYEAEPSDSQYQHVFFKVDGKTRAFRINKKHYNEINGLKTTNMSPKVRKAVRWITGTQLVKMTATTLNFWFSITGTTRGFKEVTRGRDIYDKYRFLPIMQAVLFVDFVKGLRTAIADNSIVEEYYAHGGGLSFMTTQGRPSRSYRNRNKFAVGFLQRRGINLNPVNILAYTGEKSELALRLAVYERTKKELAKQYPDATESEIKYMAVKEAREIADFAQSGELSSEVDLFIPYFNAAIQGTRASYDYARKNPVKFAEKQVQAYVVNTALAMFARLFFWEEEKDEDGKVISFTDHLANIPDYITERYNIIPTGLKDSKGEHIVLRVPKAHQFIFFDALSEITAKELVYAMRGQKIPKDLIGEHGDFMFLLEAFESSLPAGQFLPFSDIAKGRGVVTATGTRLIGAVPMASSAIAYFGNYDLFRKRVISYNKGEDAFRYVEGYKDKNVHDIYKFLADANRNISPRNLEVATEKLIGSESTLLTALLYQLTDKLLTVQEETEGVPIEKAKKGIENMYGFGKSIIYTIPKERVRASKSLEAEIRKKEAGSDDQKIKQNLKIIAKKYSLDELQRIGEGGSFPPELNKYMRELDEPQIVKKNYLKYFRFIARAGEVNENKYKYVAFAETPKQQAAMFESYFGRPEDLTLAEKKEIEFNFKLLNFELSKETKAYLYSK